MNEVNLDIKNINKIFPKGMVFSRKYLLNKGISNYTLDNYLRSGKFTLLSKGIYAWRDFPVSSDGFLASLSNLWGLEIIVSGKTALELQGFAHNLNFNSTMKVTLLAQKNIPEWLRRVVDSIDDLEVEWVYGSRLWDYKALAELPNTEITRSGFSINISSPERAVLELLNQVSDTSSFESVDNIFQGMTQLSPRKMSKALQACINVKTKRLFFWFANRYKYPWFKYLNINDFDLGKGKRVIAKSGVLDKELLITVPKDMQNKVDYG